MLNIVTVVGDASLNTNNGENYPETLHLSKISKHAKSFINVN